MQTKPFSITNAMRVDVADKLTLQAIAHHGPRIGEWLSRINATFWRNHKEAVALTLPVNPKSWPELIEAGVLTATTVVCPQYRPKDDESYRDVGYFREDATSLDTLRSKILGSPAYSTVSDFIRADRKYSHYAHSLQFVSQEGSIPRLNGMNLLPMQGELIAEALDAVDAFGGVVKGAAEFRAQALDLLAACRTSRQMEELFPEAAKLLPEPVRQERALAPTELAANVRSMLNKGVPPVLAQA